MNMFCYQCEQTAGGSGCTKVGACGKDTETASLQDLLVYAVKDISRYAHAARELGSTDKEVNVFTLKALFSTVTNVNFDEARFHEFIKQAAAVKAKAEAMYIEACEKSGKEPEKFDCDIAWWDALDDLSKLDLDVESIKIQKRIDSLGEDITGLQELIIYGIKGAAAYAEHAQILGKEDDSFYAYVHKALSRLCQRPTDADELVGLALECGAVNLKAMELLDAANTEDMISKTLTNCLNRVRVKE
jgi:hydroxylamine reductase